MAPHSLRVGRCAVLRVIATICTALREVKMQPAADATSPGFCMLQVRAAEAAASNAQREAAAQQEEAEEARRNADRLQAALEEEAGNREEEV